MASILNQRLTAQVDGEVIVFLIGMRINRPWKVQQWWPVVRAMPRMIRELSADPSSGFLGAHSWFGRTTLMLQYWRSFEQLEAYARALDRQHHPAWAAFNRRIGRSGDVGLWHETYRIRRGDYECIYQNMPPFGLARATRTIPVRGALESAAGRMKPD